MAKKKPKRKPINAKTKATLQKKAARIVNILMDSLHRSTTEDKVLIYLVVVSQLLWLLGLWVE